MFAPPVGGVLGLPTSPRPSLVLASSYLSVPYISLHMGNDTPLLASIIIPTLDRPEALAVCLRSLDAQTEQRFERILIRERGPLAALRNHGLSQAHAPVVCFIDDDVLCPPTWLSSLLRVLRESSQVMGVTGPAIITPAWRQTRDLFKHKQLRKLYDWCFIDNKLPGIISRAGTFNALAAEADCIYEGEVQYLEACNMSFRTEALRSIGGFDEAYKGIGDWSEPDACFRLRQATGKLLWFTPQATLFHQPSLAGPSRIRWKDSHNRLANYHLFSARWVPPCWQHVGYCAFLWSYYRLWKSLIRF